jgi:hypothetical protein
MENRMSCRTSAAGSALTTFARLRSGLTDVQTLSTYHALRHEGRQMPAPDDARWQSYLTEQRTAVEGDSTLTDARRRSLLRRLDTARQQRPDGASFYAMRTIESTTRRLGEQINERLGGHAAALGLTVEQVRDRYRSYQDEIDRNRSAQAPAGYDDAAAAARQAGLPSDRGSVHAMQRLEAEARRARADAALRGPQRIERQPMTSGPIAEAGYDPTGGRLEVVFNRADGQPSRPYAYRGVPAEVWAQMQSGSAGRTYNEQVRNRSEYRYASQEDADLDSAARQCADCGQFASAQHTCPVRVQREQQAASAARAAEAAAGAATPTDPAAPTSRRRRATPPAEESEVAPRPEPRRVHLSSRYRYAGQVASLRNGADLGRSTYDSLMLPRNLADMRQEAAAGPIEFRVGYSGFRHYSTQPAPGEPAGDGMPPGSFSVTATATYDRPGRGQHTADVRDPRCTCPAYQQNGHCPHVDMAVERMRAALLPAARAAGTADVAAVQAAAEQALRQDWTRSEETAAEARARWADADPADAYARNFAAFEADHDAALARKSAGEPPVPYLTENATGGLCAPNGGRGFGVEIEFDIPSGVDRHTALQAIGRDLHAAGLTRTASQQRYHAAGAAGYTSEHQGGWSYEQDCTVSGEIVSPIMYDTPETWRNLQAVCDIVKQHGGVASARTGSHVHVSSGDYGNDGRKHTELVRMANQHEDVLYRVSQHPDRGRHRPMRWCGPNRDVPPAGYATSQDARWQHGSHGLGVNLQSVVGRDSDHAEIRHWDGTLDPAVIQTQVKISAAMVDAASRNAALPGERRGREAVGSHAARLAQVRGRSRRALTSEELAEDSATARSLADTLFRRREDKAQFAALFAITKWNRAGARR